MPKIKELIEMVKETKHSHPKPVFCPNCQSSKIKLKESYGILPQLYHCEKCGYEGHIILELEPDEPEKEP